MNEQLEIALRRIVGSLQGSKEEILEIEQELRDHLYSSFENYLSEGYSKEEATSRALDDFGQEEHITILYQQVIHPIYGWMKKLALIGFSIYAIIVIWEVIISRFINRVIDFVHATGPQHLLYVHSNPHHWVEKQFFDFSLWQSNINFTPLKMIFFYAEGEYVNSNIAFYNIFGNIILFLPLGLFLPILFKKMTKLSRVTTVAFITSLVIEFIQFVLQIGMADIDDVILNTLGAIFGFSIGKMIIKLFEWKISSNYSGKVKGI